MTSTPESQIDHPDTHEWQPESDGYSNWCAVCGWEDGGIQWPPEASHEATA